MYQLHIINNNNNNNSSCQFRKPNSFLCQVICQMPDAHMVKKFRSGLVMSHYVEEEDFRINCEVCSERARPIYSALGQ